MSVPTLSDSKPAVANGRIHPEIQGDPEAMNKLDSRTLSAPAQLLVGAILVACNSMAAAGEELPDARSLIEQHIEAIGGRDAVLAQTESTLIGKFSIPAAGMSGALTVASRASGERISVIELPGLGEMRNGYSKAVAWSIDPFLGPRLIEGEELAALVERSEPGAVLRDEEFLEGARTVGRTELGGQDCYRVELSWKSGRSSHDCYAVDSGLLIAMESVETSPMGEVESLTLFGEYREMHGVKLPGVTTVRVMGQDQVLTVDELRLGAPDAALFEVPAPIRTLLGNE